MIPFLCEVIISVIVSYHVALLVMQSEKFAGKRAAGEHREITVPDFHRADRSRSIRKGRIR
jgi:hypothetical protein